MNNITDIEDTTYYVSKFEFSMWVGYVLTIGTLFMTGYYFMVVR